MQFENKYCPKDIESFTVVDVALKSALNGYIHQNVRRPLLLYGGYGAGKSTIARLLPNAIRDAMRYSDVDVIHADVRISNELEMIGEFQKIVLDDLFDTGFQLRVFIIDEVDQLTPTNMKLLRKKIDDLNRQVAGSNNEVHEMIVMTTNELSKIDRAVQSRSTVIKMVPLESKDWFPIARRIIKKEGCPVPSRAELAKMFKLYSLDNRHALQIIERYCHDHQQSTH